MAADKNRRRTQSFSIEASAIDPGPDAKQPISGGKEIEQVFECHEERGEGESEGPEQREHG